MADVALKFVVENLVPLIKETWELIGGAPEDCARLVDELDELKAFLDDAARYRQSNSKQWSQFVHKVQVIVYQAEGLVDKLLVQVKLHQDKNIFKQFFDANYAISVRELAKNIKVALEQVKKIRQENPEAFQKKPMLDDQPEIVAPRPQDTLLEENEVVGFDEEAKTVIKRLAEGRNELDVIPVVGLAGLGKTTLAIKIYKDPKVTYEFFNSIWVYVGPQEYKPKEIFLRILEGFTKRTAEHQNMSVNELTSKIQESMSKGGKCLIVLDDVWHPDVVKSVRSVFPKNSKGHKIMITTRDASIGRYANANPHMLKFLEDKESFQLLENRVFIGTSSKRCPEELVGYGESIAKQCSGLPLAVVVIAGALQGRINERVWKMVKQNVGEHLINKDKPESCLKYVELSYGHLPEDMKACFLYCGAFPQGFEIPAWKLIRLWISEGLINSNLDSKPEDIAEFYLNELVNRNLLIVMQKRADGQVKTCRLHDMLHQFCKMQNGGLFQEVCEKTDQPGLVIPDLDTCRRLCIKFSLLKAFLSKGPSAEHVRSFLCFSPKQKESEKLSNSRLLLKAFPLVRVLDVESLEFSFSKDFKELHHLRYIAISGDFSALPTFFGKFWYLQTLILNNSTKASTMEIKADIWNMLQLRHLHTNVPAKLPSPATQTTDESSRLQTLSKVAPESCTEDVLARACNLRKVSIQGQMAEFFEANKGGFNNFQKLKSLEQLKLLNDVGSSMSKVLQLPQAFLGFLHRLHKLTLSNTKFVWSDANKLGQLECLQVLKLKENAFCGTAWDSVGFTKLKVLWIERATDLET
nr:putative late blight resistance protein homolog R1C-3 [Nicotiana tomentosiformis]